MALPLVTQNDLVTELAEETGWSKGDVRNFLDALAMIVEGNVKDGYRVKLPFGVVVEPKVMPARKKRQGRNPATGEDVMIPAKPASARLKAKIVKPLADVKLPSVKKLQGMM